MTAAERAAALLAAFEAITPFEDAVQAAPTVPARMAAVMDLHGAIFRFHTEHRFELEHLLREQAAATAAAAAASPQHQGAHA